jgi:hypothetical protein
MPSGASQEERRRDGSNKAGSRHMLADVHESRPPHQHAVQFLEPQPSHLFVDLGFESGPELCFLPSR